MECRIELEHFNLERGVRTPYSENWRIIKRDPVSRRALKTLAEVEAHVDQGTTNKAVGGYEGDVVWRVEGTILFHDELTEDRIQAVRSLLDGLFTFCFDRDFTIIAATEWGEITNQDQEAGPSEIRRREGDRYVPLAEPSSE